MAVSIIEPVVFYVHDNYPDRPLRAPPVEPCPDRMGRPGRDRPSRRQSALRVRRRLSGPGLVPLRRHGRGHGTDDEGRGGAGPHVRRPPGLSRAPRARLPQVPGVRGSRGDAGEHLRRERLGPRPLARVQRVRGPGRPDHLRGAHVLRVAQQHPAAWPGDPGRACGRRRHGHARGARAARRAQAAGPSVQADLHDRELSEPGGPRSVPPPPPGAGPAGRGTRHLHPRRRRVRRAQVRRRAETPVYALDRGGRVIRAGTLSKILGAGVRLGWLCAPRAMLPAFQGFNFGGGVNPFMSRVATWYLRDHMEEHVKLLIDVYRAKRDAMLRGLWEELESTDVEISRPAGGSFIWIRLPPGTDPARLEELAVAARAQYTPGPAFFPNGGGERFIRLAFSYEPPEKCYEGARLIARAILDARR